MGRVSCSVQGSGAAPAQDVALTCSEPLRPKVGFDGHRELLRLLDIVFDTRGGPSGEAGSAWLAVTSRKRGEGRRCMSEDEYLL